MPRRREYASDAERVRAWRERKAQVEAERWTEINTLRDLVGTDDPVMSDAVDALAQSGGYAPPAPVRRCPHLGVQCRAPGRLRRWV